MLYDILPPTVFFLSLGGIMVIVSRAMVRMRREAFSADVKSYGAGDGAAVAGGRPDVARVLGPTQKGVHVVATRLGLLRMALQRTGAAVVSLPRTVAAWRSERRERKVAAKEQKVAAREAADELVADDVSGASDSSELRTQERVVMAPEPSFFDRLRSGAQERAAESGGRLAALRERAQQVRQRRQEKREARIAAQEAAQEQALQEQAAAAEAAAAKESHGVKLTHRVVRQPEPESATTTVATPAPAPQVAQAPVRKPGLLSRPKRKLTTLEQAEEALTAGQYQVAEDILVSYIVKHTKDTEAYILLGKAALGRKAWDEAMEIFEQVRRWNERQRGVHALLGHAAYCAGRYGKALECLQRAHEADPTNRAVLDELMGIARKLDNPALQHSIQEKLAELASTEEAAVSEPASV